MNYKKKILATLVAAALSSGALAANDVLVNEYVKAGVNESTGTFGSGGNTSPGLLYNSAGAGTFNTAYDYLTPGSPFDGFSIKINGTNYYNNNAGGTSIVGGWTSGSTPSATSADWTGTFSVGGSTWTVRNLYSLISGTPYVNITTTITAGSSGTGLWLGRYIDPDARAAAGDSSATDNVLGYGAIPTRNVAFSEATVSRYALGLYSTDTNVYAGIQGWTQEADGYQTSTYGANYGTGDDTIGLSWNFGNTTAGSTYTANYAYIFGPSAFGAADSAVTGGAGGGNTSILTGTLTDVGSATSAASAPSTPSGPVAVTNAAGTTASNPSGTTTLTVTNSGTYTNDGTNGDVTNNTGGSFTNSGTTGAVTNAGTFTNSGGATTGNVTNTGTFTNSGTTGTVANTGTFTNNSSGVTGAVTNNIGGTFTNNGTTGAVNNSGTFTNNVTGDTGNVTNAGTFNNYGDTGTVNNMGTFTNRSGGTVTELGYNNHVVSNYGTVTSITYNGGSVTNQVGGTVGTINTTQAHGSFNNQGTVTGNVTTNSNNFTNAATGVVQGTYTNSGTLRNYGTVGVVANSGTLTTYAGSTTGNVTNTGTVNNAGTVGDVTSSGTLNNTGTAGAVTLTGGTFANTGTVASVDNATGMSLTNNGTITGTLSNTGTVASLTNNGTIGNVTGDITEVTNTGTMTNSGTVATATNSGWFTNALNAVVGLFTNSGTAVNSGTMTTVNNTGTFGNTGTVGNVDNLGSFVNNGNTGTVTNSGTFTYNGGTLGGYTQTTGMTVMSADTPIAVSGDANLGGLLIINNAPTAYGRYSVLNANNVTGAYSGFGSNGSNDYLKYSGTDVKLYVTPDATATQASIDRVAGNIANVVNLQSNLVTSSLGNDCAVFGAAGACVSINAGMSNASTGDLYTGGITLAKKINDNWRAGVFTNAPMNNPTVGDVSMSSDPAVGGFVTWTKEQLSVQASAAFNQGTMTVTRQGPETGVGKSAVDNQAYQIKASYLVPVTETVSVTPYAGVRYTETNFNGYTETGPVFPLTVNATKKTSTDIIAGLSVAKQLTDKLSGNVSAGIVQNLSGSSVAYSGSSEIGGLTTFNGTLPSNGSTNPSLGAGLSYSIDSTTKVGANVGWQAKGSNADITSVGISLTKGF